MYQVHKQYIPGLDQIWVLKLNEQDDVYVFDVYEEALSKANELELADSSGRKYRVVTVN